MTDFNIAWLKKLCDLMEINWQDIVLEASERQVWLDQQLEQLNEDEKDDGTDV